MEIRLGIMIALLLLLTACTAQSAKPKRASSEAEARIGIYESYSNDMERTDTEPVKPTEPTAYTVHEGDTINEIRIQSVTNKKIVISTETEYTELFTDKPAKRFTIRRGDTLELAEYHLYDASHIIKISYLEYE